MTEKEKKRFLVVFLTGYLAYSAIYIARLNFSVAASLMQDMEVLNKAQIGIIGSIFSLVYALAKIPNGYIGDRFSTKNVIIIGLLIASVTNLLIGVYPSFLSIAVLWGLNAYGQSMLWGPLLRTFSENYGEERFKKISQVLISSVATGSVIGLMIATECVSFNSAALCFLIPSIITLAAAIAVKFFLADAPGKREKRQKNIFQEIQQMFGQVKFRWMIFPTAAHGMIKDNINVWLAVYFVDTYGINLENIAGIVFLVPLCAFLGRMLYMPVYRILKNDYWISMISFGCCGLASAVLCIRHLPAFLALVCLGVISALVSMINTHLLSAFPAEFREQKNLSFTASLMDVLTYGGAGIGSLCFGFLIQHFGYESMFLVWMGVSVISIWFLKYSCKKSRIWSEDIRGLKI